MKSVFLLTATVILGIVNASGQSSKVSLNLPFGYTFKDNVTFDAANTVISDGFQYGGSLEYFLKPTTSLELSYLRMDANMPLYGPGGTQLNKDEDAGSISYILFGGNAYYPKTYNAKTAPFFGGGAGVGIVNTNGQSQTKFAWNVKGGVKIKTSSVVSFKLQAQLQSVISAFGVDYWRAGDAIIAVTDYATILQLHLGGAVCIDFPSKKKN